MSDVEQYLKSLPRLRRFARAVTGDADQGDDHVAELLSALLELSDGLPDTDDADSYMFQALTKNLINARVSNSKKTEDVLQQVSSDGRIALLLTSLEGFSVSAASEIMGISPDQIDSLLAEAEKQIESHTQSSILIIEDEAIIAMLIADTVEEMGHTVVAQATTHTEAVALAEKHQPSLILSDVQLADGSSGIDATKDILRTSDVPVIFITAYPERLLTGDGDEPAFMITKPFAPELVKAVVSQALLFNKS